MGPLLHVKRPGQGPAIFGFVLGSAVLVMGGFLVAGGEAGLGAFGILCALLLFWASVWTITKRWEIYEDGIAAASAFGAQRLRFDELATFIYGRVTQEHQTRVSLELIPRRGKPLRIAMREQDFDDDLVALREKLTARVMATMEETLRRTGYVEWLAAAEGGVVPRPAVGIDWSGLIVRGRPDQHLPWAEVNMAANNGRLILRRGREGKVLVNAPVLAPNYRPGMALIDRILARGGPSAANR